MILILLAGGKHLLAESSFEIQPSSQHNGSEDLVLSKVLSETVVAALH